MKKLLFLFALLFMGAMTVFAQVPTNQQLTYQTVVRNAQNQLVFNQSNVTVLVEVCKADGLVVWYSENHTGLSTNANGLLTLMVGSSTSHTGNWSDIDWSDAAIRTTVSYDPGSGTVSIPSGLAPVTAVPYALQAGNASNITNLIGDAIHDSIVNNISSAIHDSITNYLTDNNYVTETVMGNAIHDSIINNINNISEQIHDSIVNISGDLTDLENRVNTFNTHVCDSVKDCVTGWIHDSITNIADNISEQIHDSIVNNINNISEQIHDSIVNNSSNLTDLENRVNTFNTHVCDSVKDCVTGWIHDSITNIADNISDQIHDSIVNNINNISDQIHDSIVNNINNIGEQIHDSIVNNINNIGEQIHDSIVSISGDLTDLENRVNTFNTHVCDSVQDCIKDYLNDNHYVTETVMSNAIHDSIANIADNISEQIHDSIANIADNISEQIHDSIVNNINNISEQIHDSIVNIGDDLTDLENRVNTFNTHVCDSVKDCVTGWIHDSIANIADNISEQIHDSIVNNINNNISEQIHDSIVNNLANSHFVTESSLCTTIETNCTNVALRNGNTFTGDHDFTGAGSVTVPNAIAPDFATALAAPCTQEAVNLCDLMVVFDSLSRRIQELADALDSLKNANPPTAYAPVLNNVTSSSMRVTANATSTLPIISYDFCISTNPDMSGGTWHTVQASDASYYIFEGLNSYVTYYIQYKATNLVGTATSPIASQRTPAHAPTADVTPPTTTNPAGFQVEVTDVDAKEAAEVTVRVCYIQKGAGDCPAKESSAYSTCTDPVVVADGGSATISKTILTATTDYCVVVKVSNEDSTTIYGPYTVTTGDIPSISITSDGGGTVSLCGESTKDVPFTATITNDDASNYTFAWSAGTSTTSKDTVSLSEGTHTIYVTATHTSSSFAISDTATVTVSSSGTAPIIGFCVDDESYSVSVKTASNVSSVTWGDGQSTDGPITTSTTPHEYTHSPATYNVTAYNSESGCSVEKKISLGGHNPYSCAVTNAHTDGSTYTSTTGGLETVNGEGKVVSVQDQDGHTYAVTQIGNYCLIRTNLRTTKYNNGNNITNGGNNVSTTTAYYYQPTSSTWGSDNAITFEMYNDSIFGYYYNGTATLNANLCPKGWHVPTNAEWTNIVNAAGNKCVQFAGGCLWDGTRDSGTYANNYGHPDRDKWGFSAVPAGNRSSDTKKIKSAGSTAYFWSSTSNTAEIGHDRRMYSGSETVSTNTGNRATSFSIRCIRSL